MSVLLPLAAWLALGLPAAAVLWRQGRPEQAAAVVPFAGALAILLALLPVAWLGADLTAWPVLTPLASLGVAAGLAGMLRGSGTPAPAAETGPAASAVSVALLVGACALPLGVGFELARGWPGYEWDGLVIWLVRARVLAESDAFPGHLFAEPSLAQGHWDYPLLFPALLAWFARLGGLELRGLPVALGIFAALFPLATAAGLARTLRLPLAAAVALAPFAVPDLPRFHFHAYADPLLVLLGVAGMAWTTAAALRWDLAGLATGGLALAAAVATKNEGILWLLAGAISALLLSSLRRLTPGQRALGVARVVLPGLLLFALWQLTCTVLDTPDALASQLRWDLVGRRFAPLSIAVLQHLFTPALAPLLLGSLLALALGVRGTALERLRQAGLLLSGSAVLLGGLFLVYLGTPYELPLARADLAPPHALRRGADAGGGGGLRHGAAQGRGAARLRRTARMPVAVLLAAWLGGCTADQEAPPADAPPPAPAERMILIGLDGVGWPMLDAVIQAGRAPWLAGLVDSGVSARLWSEQPSVSPALWTTLLTGRGPEAHGIHGFTARAPGGEAVVPAQSSMRRVPALWQYLNHFGRSVGIVGAHVTWPAEPVDGFLVSRRVAEPGSSYAVHPPQLAARAGPGDLAGFESLLVESGFLSESDGDRRYAFMRQTWQTDTAAFELGAAALAEQRPDFLFLYFHLPDSAQHTFWPPDRVPEPGRDFEPIFRVYEYVDRRIARLVEPLRDARTAVVVVSDHGAAGTGIAVLFERHTDRLLHALGYLSRGPGGAIDRGASLVLPGPASGEMVRFWVNREHPVLASRDDLREAFTLRVLERLRGLRLERADRPLFRQVERSAEDPDVISARIDLRSLDDANDFVLFGHRRARFSDLYRPAPLGGGHTLDGVIVAAGAPFRRGVRQAPSGPAPRRPEEPGIRDVAPTILAALGLDVPDTLDGRVLESLLHPELPVPARRSIALDWKPFRPADLGAEAAEPDAMLEMLQALGYAQ